MSDVLPAWEWDQISQLLNVEDEMEVFHYETTPQKVETVKQTSQDESFVICEGQENAATNKKTASDMDRFRAYLRCTNDERDIENLPQELDRLFGNCLLGARKARDNVEYEPSILRGFMSSLDRYLKNKGAQFQVLNNPMFPHSNTAIKAKQKELKSKGIGNKPNAAEELTDADILK